MAKIIMIEGIDRVGKTTLANILKAKLGIGIFKDFSVTSGNDITANIEKMATLINIVEQLDLDIICDRSYLTEYVYSFVEKRTENPKFFYEYVTKMLFEKVQQKKVAILLVYVRPSDIKLSQELHGSSLTEHNIKYNDIYEKVPYSKIVCSWDTLLGAVEAISDWYKSNGGE